MIKNIKKLMEFKEKLRVSYNQLARQCWIAGYSLTPMTFFYYLNDRVSPKPETTVAVRAAFVGAAKEYCPEMLEEVEEFFDAVEVIDDDTTR